MKKVSFLLILLICIATTQAQNVGIGTVTPQASLDIIGNIKITDQSQGDGKILTSDNNGWEHDPLQQLYALLLLPIR